MALKQTRIGNFWNSLPPNGKIIIVALVALILLIIVIVIAKKIKQIKDDKGIKVTTNAASSEYKKLVAQGERLSASAMAYQQTVNSIATNLSGCDSLSTELKVIDDITKVVKKPVDWYYLVDLFDVKTIPDCGWGSTNYALPELLKDQLDTGGVYAGLGGGIGSGITTESINLLEAYLKKIGVTL